MHFEVGVMEDTRYFEPFLPQGQIDLKESLALGLVSNNTACGALTGHMDSGQEVFMIDSIFVAKEARRKGGGTLLLDTLLDELREQEEPVPAKISFIEADDDADALYEFLLDRGLMESESDRAVYLIPAEDVWTYVEDGGDISHPLLKDLRERAKNAKDAEELPLDLLKEEEKELIEKSFPDAANLFHSFVMV